jgi:hypothetical protein
MAKSNKANGMRKYRLKVYAATMFIIFGTKEFLCRFVDDDDVLGFYAV